MAFDFEEKLRYLQEMGVDTPEGILQLLSGVGEEESQYPQGVMDFQGYDKMINQHYDEWSPTDGIPGQGNPHTGEPISNLGLPDTASYSPGYSTDGNNPNWGSGKYNYKKNIYDVQTIDMMINSGEINPKRHLIVPRPDVGDGLYQIKLASDDNTLWNDQLQMFMSPDWMRSGTMGGEQFKENIMGGGRKYKSLRSNTYPGSSNQPLDFNRRYS